MTTPLIIGAGLSGLMAGCLFQTATIQEAGPPGITQHKAVLRFRSPAVADAMGVEFRKVRVHKGIYHEGRFRSPDIQLANLYALKVTGRLGDRSVWSTETVDRFIAPEDLTAILAERCLGRVRWNAPVTREQLDEARAAKRPIISTMPMNVLAGLLGQLGTGAPVFSPKPIRVARFRVAGADVFQSVYFPSPSTPVYRASITGDLLIVEATGTTLRDGIDRVHPEAAFSDAAIEEVLYAFGLERRHVQPLEQTRQNYGKIAPIDEAWRRSFIRGATEDAGVYSLGRFAVWRNILADDVLHDIAVIKRLIAEDRYGARLVKVA